MARKSLSELLNGQRVFGRLTVVREVRGNYVPANGTYRRAVKCDCDCGSTATVELQSLKRGVTKSCGCLNIKVIQDRTTTHGHSCGGKRTSEYSAWKSAKARCYIPSVSNFAGYGGRGIKMCDRWCNSFENFLDDMGRKPSPELSIDRIDNDGDYEPGNCRWAPLSVQAGNRRNNLVFEYLGRRYTCSEAARAFGLKPHTLADRLRKGWLVADAIETPLQPGIKFRI